MTPEATVTIKVGKHLIKRIVPLQSDTTASEVVVRALTLPCVVKELPNDAALRTALEANQLDEVKLLMKRFPEHAWGDIPAEDEDDQTERRQLIRQLNGGFRKVAIVDVQSDEREGVEVSSPLCLRFATSRTELPDWDTLSATFDGSADDITARLLVPVFGQQPYDTLFELAQRQ